MHYNELLEIWLTAIKPELRGSSYAKYARCARFQIEPELGEYELSKLSSDVVRDFILRKSEECSVSSALNILSMIRRSLVYAESIGLKVGNVKYTKVKLRRTTKSRNCLTSAQQAKVEEYVLSQPPDKAYGIVLCLYTGLRAGELLALTWSDIDFEGGYLSVNKTCRDGYGEGKGRIVDAPKTPSSNRIIPLPRSILAILKKMRKVSRSELVIESKKGEPVSMRSYLYTFGKILERLGIPHMGLHALRHTFATRAIECGMDARTLSEIMGHSSVAITLAVYAHSLDKHKYEMMNKLGKNLNPNTTKKFLD